MSRRRFFPSNVGNSSLVLRFVSRGQSGAHARVLGLVLGLGLAMSASVGTTACSKSNAETMAGATSSAPVVATNGTHAVTANEKGFTPSSIALKKGEKAEIVFTRTTDATCATEVVFPEINLRKDLPLNKPVAINVPTDTARTLTFQCGMGMFKSAVVIN